MTLKYKVSNKNVSVQSIFCTYNHTFVFFCIDYTKRHTIIHADSKGNVLYKKEYENYLDRFFFNNSRWEVVIGPFYFQ